MSTTISQEKADSILSLLKKHYPNAKIVLNYSNPWELLVSVILSAQCTDKRVNIVTQTLFAKYKTTSDYSHVKQEEFEQDIKSTGFYRNKAKNIIAAAKLIQEKFNGKIPKTMEEMLTIPGVARKTANVVLGNTHQIVEGIAVDTHVIRLSQRLGFSDQKDPVKIEKDLMQLFPKEEWFGLTYRLIDHGRAICEAKKPKCDECFLNNVCPSAFQFPHFK
ncbi:MAG: endonuclease III protein, endonuclease III [Microgenomates group bacterium GW2011_GWC1_41_8]|uniref:Endonuclease III n=3 Tax=Candidatus Roizmaniibacteriota TaxID=1752723 RepID=A0A0G1ABR6_9BACT|nr:MAG: Endonuclease III [Candidatus Levybacteria bacterium GW2011_GWA2_40_16]KKR71837.1 MAG: Endonuclease III [Candidatus Roizmanbacteria bacterium GW2011_GWB1_40_7]KKR92664.1 MAG: Endonuclease III [Candidatus Roizmanbacteria bacterium GW2011_GWA1_41_13]KKS22683.1 MAG: Endonuclease III [Candidatus Roizmanbacteria bacterium GW2011_GWC2_41_7]KKS24607.1 MAG: endonuclease III protein, endonuclease III [Microgenomates group bacterium GW2011_GWC1_41_8]OGK48120.1 MAG: endonuclease III [Candidatus Ro